MPVESKLFWVDHLGMRAGDPSVVTSFNAVNSGVGGGLFGLIIESTTTGEIATGGGSKEVTKALDIPPNFSVQGVRICYELSNPRSFFSNIRLTQLEDPPASALVLLEDSRARTDSGPICVDSFPPNTPIDPTNGSVTLSLRVNFGDSADRIVLRGVGLHLVATTGPTPVSNEDPG